MSVRPIANQEPAMALYDYLSVSSVAYIDGVAILFVDIEHCQLSFRLIL